MSDQKKELKLIKGATLSDLKAYYEVVESVFNTPLNDIAIEDLQLVHDIVSAYKKAMERQRTQN